MALSPWFLERRENQEVFQLEFGENLLGRMETTQIVVASVFASRNHCKITVSQTNPDEVYLEDLGTCNGTWINTEVKNGERVRLREGDKVGIGCTIDDRDDDRYYTFIVKRDNVSIDNIIINIDEEEEDCELEEEDSELEESSVEEIEDDIIEEVSLKQEQEIEKEVSFNMKQEMLEEIIEIEDIFSEQQSNDCKIEEDGDLFLQYKIKPESSMREQESDVVLISDSEDEDIKEMNNWVLKLSQNFKAGVIKQESDEESNDNFILNELRSVLSKLPDDDQIKDEPDELIADDEYVESIIPKFEIDDDDFIQITDPIPPFSHQILQEVSKVPDVPSLPPTRRCSVFLEKIDLLETDTKPDLNKKQQSDSDDEVRPPKRKRKRILSISNKALFGPDEDDEGEVAKINIKEIKPRTKHRSDVTTERKPCNEIRKRKTSLYQDEITKINSSEKEKSDQRGASSSKISRNGDRKSKHKRRRSSSKEQSESKHRSLSKSRLERPNGDVTDQSKKKMTPERDPDFIEKPVPKTMDETLKTKTDHKKPRQLEIIEPLNMPHRKSRIEKPKSFDDMLRAQSRAIKAQKNENNYQNLKKKWKQVYSADKPRSSRSEMEKGKEERKNRLQQIALASKCEKNVDEDAKVVNMPKVKVTVQNRGSFLTEALPCKIPGRRKSVLATDTRTIGKPAEETKTSKLSSINDLGTVGKSISAFPKIPKVTRATSVETNIKSPQPNSRNVEPVIPLQTSLTKTALKPRVARTVCEESIKSPTSPGSSVQPIHDPDAKPKKSSLITKRTSQHTTKNPKKVRFSDDISIRLYEIIHNKKLLNVSEAILKDRTIANDKKNYKNATTIKKALVSLNFHPGENVINDITSWNPDWLKMGPNTLPAVNGHNILLPIVHTYRSCTEYENIMIPLVKVELWHQIRNDYELRKHQRYHAIVVSEKLMPKGDGMRYEFICELQGGLDDKRREMITEGMLLKVSAADKHFFAYMVFKEIMRTADPQVTLITIQTAQSAITDTIHNDMKVEITSIAYIRLDVLCMGYIFDLKESPLCDMILNPPIHIEVPTITNEYNPLLDATLNENQYNIVNYATKQCLEESKPGIVLIDGPPGTGKSYLITNLVSTLLYSPENIKLKILICSASNNAIDIIMEKLIDIRMKNKKTNNSRDIRLLRHGVLEKMSPAVQAYSVQNLCKKNVDTWKREFEFSSVMNGASVKTLLLEQSAIEARIDQIDRNGCSSSTINERSKLEESLSKIKAMINGKYTFTELRNKEKETLTSLICKADVICTTLTSCVHLLKTLQSIDVCIIDEATQCTEPWSIIPLKFKIKTLILVGDTKQLPAVVLSTNAKEKGLVNSLFTRIQHSFEVIAATPILPMTTQYRMHPEICEFPNKYFYGDQLKSSYKINADVPLRPYSVISLNFAQNGSDNNSSVYNKDEAKFIGSLLFEISKLMDLKKVQIGVITPYHQQKNEITRALSIFNFKNVYVNTIDSFQGKEADIIILATTRTTGAGFLGHPQRLNVALTRARHSLIICGNFITLKHVPIWSSLVKDAQIRQLFYKFDDNFKNLLQKLI